MHEMKRRYYFAEGSVRFFLSGADGARMDCDYLLERIPTQDYLNRGVGTAASNEINGLTALFNGQKTILSRYI